MKTPVMTLAAVAAFGAFAWENPTVTANRPLIFPDDGMIAEKSNLSRSFHKAVTDKEPVVKKDFKENQCAEVYGSVWKQKDGSYRMWYNDHSWTMIADSKDGVRWTKPLISGYWAKPGETNNAAPGAIGHCISVLDDKFEKDPSRRYKFLGCMFKFTDDWAIVTNVTGYYSRTSADGVYFTPDAPIVPANRVLRGWDTSSLVQHPETGEIFCYHKIVTPDIAGKEEVRRVVYLSRTKDFIHWTEPELVMAPDEQDDSSFIENHNQRVDIYTQVAYPYAGGFIGFISMFRIDDRRNAGHFQTSDFGFCDVQMVTSPDGIRWSRTPGRRTVIGLGQPGEWDGGGIWGLGGGEVVSNEKESMLYYTAESTAHGREFSTKPSIGPAVGRAVWRRWGFTSLGCSGAGRLTTRPVKFATDDIRLNLVPVPDPFGNVKTGVTVQVYDAEGKRLLAESEPLAKDETLAKVVWKNGAKVPVNAPVVLKFAINAAAVYAVECL